MSSRFSATTLFCATLTVNALFSLSYSRLGVNRMKSKSISSFFAVVPSKRQKVSIASSVTMMSLSSEESSKPIDSSIESTINEVSIPILTSEKIENDVDGLFVDLESAWRNILQNELGKKYMMNLSAYVKTESVKGTIFPPLSEVFTAFKLCPYDKVKVVILGQDPYHGPGQAHGLAFSVKRGVSAPPSLKNIFKEAHNDVGINIPAHGCLEDWAKQGVLLLNTCLTVRSGQANSHQGQGWEQFTDAVVRELDRKEGLVFILWGNPAQTKCKAITASKHHIIKSSHPSPLGAAKTAQPFLGSRCFSRCNTALESIGKTPIDWTISR